MKVVLQDIVGAVQKTTKLARPDAQVIVRRILKVLEEGLISGQRVELRNFGVFQTKIVSGRKGRDLNRNLTLTLPPYKKVSFRAGKNLRKLFRDLPDEPKVLNNGQLEMPMFLEESRDAELTAGK
jgi:nucleoid DNA-binding protein